jgi:hypothetical protein
MFDKIAVVKTGKSSKQGKEHDAAGQGTGVLTGDDCAADVRGSFLP